MAASNINIIFKKIFKIWITTAGKTVLGRKKINYNGKFKWYGFKNTLRKIPLKMFTIKKKNW